MDKKTKDKFVKRISKVTEDYTDDKATKKWLKSALYVVFCAHEELGSKKELYAHFKRIIKTYTTPGDRVKSLLTYKPAGVLYYKTIIDNVLGGIK